MKFCRRSKAKIFESMEVAVNCEEVVNNFDDALWEATISSI